MTVSVGTPIRVTMLMTLVLVGCGESTTSEGLRTLPPETDTERNLVVSDLDACSAELADERTANPPRAGDEDLLATWFGEVEYWIELPAAPDVLEPFADEPYFTRLAVDLHLSTVFEAREFGSPQRANEPDVVSDFAGKEFFIKTDAARRLRSLRLDSGESALLGVGWSPTYESWYVYQPFAARADGSVVYIDDCGGHMTQNVESHVSRAASDGFVGTARDILVGMPFEVVEKYDFGVTDEPEGAAPTPGFVGSADLPLHLRFSLNGMEADVLICAMQGDQGLCFGTQANNGDDYQYTMLFDRAAGDINLFVRESDKSQAGVRTIFSIPVADVVVDAVLDVSIDDSLTLEIGQIRSEDVSDAARLGLEE